MSVQLSNKAHEGDVWEGERFLISPARRVITQPICAWVEPDVEQLIRAVLGKKKSFLTFYSVSVLNPKIVFSKNEKVSWIMKEHMLCDLKPFSLVLSPDKNITNPMLYTIMLNWDKWEYCMINNFYDYI